MTILIKNGNKEAVDMSYIWRPETLGLRIRPSEGTERLVMLENLGGTYYVVCYKPRRPTPSQAAGTKPTYTSYSESIGQASEFCREGYAVVSEDKIEKAEAQRIFDLLQQAVVPALCAPSIGCDGKTYELFWDDHFGGASFKWWVDPPAEWKSLKAVADILQQKVFVWGFD